MASDWSVVGSCHDGVDPSCIDGFHSPLLGYAGESGHRYPESDASNAVKLLGLSKPAVPPGLGTP